MKQKRFIVEQIVGVLKQAEAGVPLAELIRRVGISGQSLYRLGHSSIGVTADIYTYTSAGAEREGALVIRAGDLWRSVPSCSQFG